MQGPLSKIRTQYVCTSNRLNLLVSNVDRARSNNVAELSRVERGHQFAFAAEARDELVYVAHQLARFDVAFEKKTLGCQNFYLRFKSEMCKYILTGI